MSFEWHSRYHRAALDGMLTLGLEARGAYNTVLDLIYAKGAPVADDPRWLAGWMGCSVKKWLPIRAQLIARGKLVVVEHQGQACLTNPRAMRELDEADLRRRKAADSGRKGGMISADARRKLSDSNALAEGAAAAPPELKTGSDRTPTPDAAASCPQAFEAVWRLYPHVRGRSSKPKSLAQWRRLPAAAREALPAAVARYAREGREPRAECGAPAMDRWLRDGRHLDWLQAERPSDAPVTPEVAAARLRHYRDTGEWRAAWGARPE
jgi:hypothetical protein